MAGEPQESRTDLGERRIEGAIETTEAEAFMAE